MLGQINLGSIAGDFIYKTCLMPQNNIIVEIGTWNGLGSTKCAMKALIDKEFSEQDKMFSIETSKKMHDLAVQNWQTVLLGFNSLIGEKLNLIHGRIIEKEELIPLEELRNYKDYISDWENWYKQDLENIQICKNVLEDLPKNIDVLILDGGEFSTLAEFYKLKDRSRVIICDDSNITKCKKVRQILLEDKSFKIMIDLPNERNGFCAFERI